MTTRHSFVLLLATALACGGGSTRDWLRDETPHAAAKPKHGHDALADVLAKRDKTDDLQFSAWYDPTLLTGDLRPEALRGLASTAGPLDELTLYDFDLNVADDARNFTIDERVYYENKTRGPLNDVMFRMYANTAPGGAPPEKLLRGHCLETACAVTTVGRDVIVVHPSKPLAPGARIRIMLHVAGTLRTIDASRARSTP
jgi:hypothetical protein